MRSVFTSDLLTSREGRSIGLGLLLIIEALLAFVPLIVLGPAIGWPASLTAPAAQQLAAIGAAPAAVIQGYGAYLLYSLLIAPVMVWMAARSLGDLRNPLAATVVVFAALSTLARAIGILRWLTVMPVLSRAHAAAAPADKAAIEQLFTALTVYGGGIGEILGVSLLMAIALGLLCAGAWVRQGMPAWLAALGVLTAVSLAGLSAPMLELPFRVPSAVAVSLLSLWMLLAGARELLRRTSP